MCDELAGIVGVDPNPLSLRDLWRMAWANRREHWDHTCSLIAMMSSEKIDPNSINPMRKQEAERLKTPELKKMEANEMMALIGLAIGDKNAAEKWLLKRDQHGG